MLLNRLISGSCADAFKLCAVRLDQLGVPAINYVHDEILIECPEDQVEEVKRTLEQVMPVEMHHGDLHLTGLRASADHHQRWSGFKRPEYSPWRDDTKQVVEHDHDPEVQAA
jgi:DNA polymerase I-like protein with 3'-5' exonuclease and polymerase domains